MISEGAAPRAAAITTASTPVAGGVNVELGCVSQLPELSVWPEFPKDNDAQATTDEQKGTKRWK